MIVREADNGGKLGPTSFIGAAFLAAFYTDALVVVGDPATEIAARFIKASRGVWPMERSSRPTFIAEPPLYFIGAFAVTLHRQNHDGEGRPPNP